MHHRRRRIIILALSIQFRTFFNDSIKLIIWSILIIYLILLIQVNKINFSLSTHIYRCVHELETTLGTKKRQGKDNYLDVQIGISHILGANSDKEEATHLMHKLMFLFENMKWHPNS